MNTVGFDKSNTFFIVAFFIVALAFWAAQGEAATQNLFRFHVDVKQYKARASPISKETKVFQKMACSRRPANETYVATCL